MTASVESEQDWVSQVTSLRHDETDYAADVSDDQPADVPIDLDACNGHERRPGRLDRQVACLVAAGLVAALVLAVVFNFPGRPPAPAPKDTLGEPQAIAVARPTRSTAVAAGGVDRRLPYTAVGQGSCAPGSAPAQTMLGTDPRNAFTWVNIFGRAAPGEQAPPPVLSLNVQTSQSTSGDSDPVDGRFAIEDLKIIGHEAV